MRNILAILFAAATAGCATNTGTDGVVNIGPDMYMIGGQGGFFDYSSSAVKARMFQDAQKYCAGKGLTMVPMNSTGKDSAPYQYASAEVQFRCIKQ